MSLNLKKAVEDALHEPVTRPIFVLAHELSGTPELVSCSGEVLYNGNLYERGGCNVVSIADSQSATITIPATPERIGFVTTGAWRKGECRIYHIPGDPSEDTLIFDDEDDGILLIDGQIQTASFPGDNLIKFTVTHNNNLSRLTPRNTWDDLSVHVPAPGTELVWDGGRYILQTRDRTREEVKPKTSKKGGTLSASDMKDMSQPPNIALTVTGAGVPIEVIFGERTVAGKIIAVGETGGGDLVIAVGWGFEVSSIEQTYINGEAPPVGVTMTHYTGKFNQGVDPTLAANIAAFNSPFVLRNSNGVLGASYSVYVIPPGLLSQSPTFNAVVKGRPVHDPRITASNDPQYANDVVAYVFDEQGDIGPNALVGVPYGTASITGGYLLVSGTDAAFVIPDIASMAIAANSEFEITVRFIAADYSSGADQVICCSAGTGSGDFGWEITLNSTGSLRWRCSDTGVQSALCNVEIANLSAAVGEQVLVVRRYNDSGTYKIQATVNGIDTATLFTSSSAIFDASLGISVGARSDGSYSANEFLGYIKYFRFTNGGYRTALLEGESTISALPFPEYGQYSDNSALCMADVITNPMYGVGVQALGVEACADYDDELLEGGFPRCRLSLSLAQTQTSMSYLDLLGEYAECFYYNEGKAIRMRPNKIVGFNEASGREVVVNGSFSTDSDWTKGTGWTIAAGVASCDGTQVAATALSQAFEITASVKYAVGVTITRVAGTYSLEFCGDEYVPSVGTSTSHEFVLDGVEGMQSIQVIGDSDFVGSVSFVTIRQLYHLEEKFIKGSLSIEGLDDGDSPTSVTAKYTNVVAGPNWAEKLGNKISVPGVDTNEVSDIETVLYVQGVTRIVEANNKANNRLARYINRVKYTYETSDHAVRFKRGDVIQLRKETHGLDATMRCQSVEFSKYGRYKVTGMRYSDDQHPSEVILPEGTGVVPIGAIVPVDGAIIPDGWERYDSADDRFIVGAGSTYDVGDFGGSNTHAGFSGNTSGNDMHENGGDTDFYMQITKSRFKSALVSMMEYIPKPVNTVHDHAYTTGVITPDPLKRRQRLMIKVGSADTQFPQQAQIFGLPNLFAANVSRITSAAGRLLQAANAQGNAGASVKTISLTTGVGASNHLHYQASSTVLNREPATLEWPSPGQTYYDYVPHSGNHTHTWSVNAARNVKRRAIPLFGATAAFNVVPGMCVLWAGSIVSLPSDWVLCDGTNGTYDFRDYFLEISQLGQEGVASGDNTLVLTNTTSSHSHNHRGAAHTSTDRKYAFLHQDNGSHRHTITRSDAWVPPYYALAMIMYAPT